MSSLENFFPLVYNGLLLHVRQCGCFLLGFAGWRFLGEAYRAHGELALWAFDSSCHTSQKEDNVASNRWLVSS